MRNGRATLPGSVQIQPGHCLKSQVAVNNPEAAEGAFTTWASQPTWPLVATKLSWSIRSCLLRERPGSRQKQKKRKCSKCSKSGTDVQSIFLQNFCQRSWMTLLILFALCQNFWILVNTCYVPWLDSPLPGHSKSYVVWFIFIFSDQSLPSQQRYLSPALLPPQTWP